ncbi:MAG: hypothetical protein HY905_00175 [Deltaproteobacteria bacterium]|nr:hypothetical protein [Deltaproteobacteria bacterium]
MPVPHLPSRTPRIPAAARILPALPALLLLLSSCIPFADPTWDRRHADYVSDADGGWDDDATLGDSEDDAPPLPWECDDLCAQLAAQCPPSGGDADCATGCTGLPPEEISCRRAAADDARLLPAGDAHDEACGMASGETPCVDPCEPYCDAAISNCRGEHARWTNRTECLSACRAWAYVAAPWCALEHARLAATDPAEECRHASEDSCFCWSWGASDACDSTADSCDTPLDLLEDCGACGVACADDESCLPIAGGAAPGSCVPDCARGPRCDGACFDPLRDPARCGATTCDDGTACVEGELCDGTGLCGPICAPGLLDCGTCVDPSTDKVNCGSCGNACGPHEECRGGFCDCVGLFSDCDGARTNGCEAYLPADASNCGACGTPCAPEVSLAAGRAHTCAAVGGEVWCWGEGSCEGCGGTGDCGLLGTGDALPSPRPVLVPGLAVARRVAVGTHHSCALLSDGTAWCWGCGAQGQLGQGTYVNAAAPAPASLAGIALLESGPSRTCGTTAGGASFCWGSGVRSEGMIWGATAEPRPVDFPAPEALAVGDDVTCALAAGRVRCAGRNTGGQLAAGTRTEDFTAVARVVGLTDAVELAVTSAGGCAVVASGEVRCWGQNAWGQAGPGPAVVTEPQAVALTGPVSGLAAGFNTVCAVDQRQRVVCWGVLLGAAHPEPIAVAVPDGAVDVAVGESHFCAAATDGRVWCWGKNDHGQLGDGSTTDSLTPVEVTFE